MRRHQLRGARRVPFGRTLMVLQALAALAFVGYLLSHERIGLGPARDTFTLRAAFPDAAGLKTADHPVVLVSGVPVGHVKAVRYERGLAVATMEIERSAEGKIHDGASARVQPRSALQDLTVDIAPGPRTAPALRDSAQIPPSRTSTTVGLDRVLGVLDTDTRAQAQVLLGQLAVGLNGRAGELRDGVGQLGRVVSSTGRVSAALDARRVLLARLVRELDTMFKTLGDRGTQLADAIDAGQRTLAVTGARNRELAATVRALPGALDAAGAAMRALDALSGPLDPALTRLVPVAHRLPAALSSLRRFIGPGRGLIRDLDTLSRRGRRPAAALRRTLTTLRPAATDLRPTAEQLLPVLRAVDRNKTGVGELGDHFSGVFSTNDANGPILRGLGFFEQFNPANVGFPANAGGAELLRAKLDSIKALTWVCSHRNALACLTRYLIPGLPGTVVPSRLAARPLGGSR